MEDEKLFEINDGFIAPPSIEEEPKQYLGGTLPYEVRLEDGNWRKYRSKFEDQKHGGSDKMNCVSESCTNVVEEQINWLIETNQIETEPIKDWLDENGKFESSQRFIAKMSNTNTSGNTQMAVGDALRKYGLPPENMWITPKASEYMSWADYYKTIPQSVKDKAKELLNYFSFSYERITDGSLNNLLKEKKQVPIWIASATCAGWGYKDIVPACSTSPNHATTFDCHELNKWLGDLDHYDPYEKKLAWNYKIYYPYKLVVNPLPTILKKKEEEEEENMKFYQKKGTPNIYIRGVGDDLYHRIADENTFVRLFGDFRNNEIEELDLAESFIGEPVYLSGSILKTISVFLSQLRGN